MSDRPAVDKEQARDQLDVCESEIKDAFSKGLNPVEADRSLKISRSFFRLGMFEKAFLFAVRGRRLLQEFKARRPAPS